MIYKIPILSNAIPTVEAHAQLSTLLDDEASVDLILQQESKDAMALDPVTLVAIISGSSMILSAIITGLFSIWTEKAKSQKSQKTSEVIIRLDKRDEEQTEIVFPYELTKDEQHELIQSTIQLSEIKYIMLIEKENK